MELAKYRMNHVGFLPDSPKRVYSYAPADLEFTVEHLYKTEEYKTVFRGRFEEITREDGTVFVGDFSCVREEGDYRIRCGGEISRFFRIQKNVYEPVLRILLNYFHWQRCGSPLGYHGACHLDDGYIAETGEHVDLSGGYHQSCDLRKSPCGVSLGVLNMIRAYKRMKDCAWAEIEWVDEIRWAADYYVKTVQPCGRVYNTLNTPHGWDKGREFFLSEPPASASWTVVRILAEASSVIGDRKEIYLEIAKRCFDYMMSDQRYAGKYHHPAPTPWGMDQEYFYADIYKDSTADLCYAVGAAVAMYNATGEECYYEAAAGKCEMLLTRFSGDSGILKADADREDNIASSSYVRITAHNEAVADMLSIVRDGELREKLEDARKKLLAHFDHLCGRSVWGLYPRMMSRNYLDSPAGFAKDDGILTQTVRDTLTTPLHDLDEHYTYTFGGFAPNRDLQSGVEYQRLSGNGFAAQGILDYLMGCNPEDSTCITGVGFRHSHPMVFGQFFPSTPSIPGGITIGLGGLYDGSRFSEYDMPGVGLAMYALTLL